MIPKMSRNIARTLVENSIISFDDRAVYQYGVEMTLITVFEAVVVFFIAWLTGYFWETCIFIIGFTPLRFVAGGHHAKTVYRCLFFFIFLASLSIGLVYRFQLFMYPYVRIALAVLALGLIFRFAPTDVENKRVDGASKAVFKKWARILGAAYMVLVLGSLFTKVGESAFTIFSMGMFMEALTLVRVDKKGGRYEKNHA